MSKYFCIGTARDFKIMVRAIGLLIIYFTLRKHFNIHETILEALLMGIGMGFIVIA